jgi:hypothetical protein
MKKKKKKNDVLGRLVSNRDSFICGFFYGWLRLWCLETPKMMTDGEIIDTIMEWIKTDGELISDERLVEMIKDLTAKRELG